MNTVWVRRTPLGNPPAPSARSRSQVWRRGATPSPSGRGTAIGTWSAAPAVLSFTITPPYWRTWWFLAAVGLAAVSAVVLFVRRRLRTLEAARRVQEEFSRRLIESQEQERKRIAAELHDSLGQSLLIIKNKAELGAAQSPGTPRTFRISRRSPRAPLRRCGRSPTICVRISWTNSA